MFMTRGPHGKGDPGGAPKALFTGAELNTLVQKQDHLPYNKLKLGVVRTTPTTKVNLEQKHAPTMDSVGHMEVKTMYNLLVLRSTRRKSCEYPWLLGKPNS